MEIKKQKIMNGVKKTFDKWAQNGRAELMENEHGNNVLKFLHNISFEKPELIMVLFYALFSFLINITREIIKDIEDLIADLSERMGHDITEVEISKIDFLTSYESSI